MHTTHVTNSPLSWLVTAPILFFPFWPSILHCPSWTVDILDSFMLKRCSGVNFNLISLHRKFSKYSLKYELTRSLLNPSEPLRWMLIPGSWCWAQDAFSGSYRTTFPCWKCAYCQTSLQLTGECLSPSMNCDIQVLFFFVFCHVPWIDLRVYFKSQLK